ncbi:hypothetical protein R3I94_014588 [Phoxinus phoxinus]
MVHFKVPALTQLIDKGGMCARVMANEVNSELTSAVTDPSSGSLLGDKTTGEGDVDSSADSSPDTGGKDKDDNRFVDTSETKNSKETEKATDINESGDGFKDIDKAKKEMGKDEDLESSLDRDMNLLDAEAEKEPMPSLEVVDSSADSSPDTGGKDKDDNRFVDTSETKNSKETEKARDINESGDGFKDIDKAKKEMGKDEDQDRDMNLLDAEAEKEPTPSLEDVDSSADSSPDTGGKDKDDKRIVDTSETKNSKETEKATDINESGDGFKDIDKAKKEMGKDEDLESSLDRDMNLLDAEAEKEPMPSLEESLQHKSSGFLQESQPQIRVGGNDKLLWICAAVVVLLAAVVSCGKLYLSASTPPVPKEFNRVDVFNQEMEKLKTKFPNQRPELWRRSLIHLRRHLKTEQHTEPVSLILTSGHRAERTLGCLAQCLAHAFSTALNSSVLNIDGKNKTSQDSDQVKLDIDSELRNAFESKTFSAVIHRFEELPPGSTLIFYRYCDHENAAYKDVFLVFTVMLDTEVEVPSNITLGSVEEMVQDHVKQKFISSDKLATFNKMDVDKLSGLWSRISHLILPVAAEEKIEHHGCGGDCGK